MTERVWYAGGVEDATTDGIYCGEECRWLNQDDERCEDWDCALDHDGCGFVRCDACMTELGVQE